MRGILASEARNGKPRVHNPIDKNAAQQNIRIANLLPQYDHVVTAHVLKCDRFVVEHTMA